jgi:hypothetical protein|tara:strand:- start:273 stop:1031 length:759 start_codon:yes stop_codon:yes gene_type:complete
MLGLGNTLSGGIVPAVDAFDSYSLIFDGTDEYVDLDDAASVMSGAAGSFSIWVKYDDAVTGDSFKYSIQFYTDSENYIHMGLRQSTQDYAVVAHEAGDTYKQSKFAIDEDWDGDPRAWHHVIATWSDATGDDELIVYVDGSQSLVQINTVTGLGTFSGTPVNMRLGHSMIYGTSNYEMEGNINDVAIFNDVLTEAEAIAIYNEGTPKDESSHSGLVGYWKFEENAGTTVADSSSYSNTGTLVNGTSFDSDTP